MFQFFETLLNLISTGIDFILNSFQQVIALFTNAVSGLAFISLAFNYMPGFLQPILVSLLGIAVVKFILNLGGN